MESFDAPEAPGPWLRAALEVTRRTLRGLKSRRRPGAVGRLASALVTIPVVILAFLISRTYEMLHGPLCVEARVFPGWSMACRLPDMVQMYVYLFGVWEPDISHYVRRGLTEGRTFVDVGAHVGYFTLLAAHLTGPTGRVVSVEASPRTHALLVSNIAAAGIGDRVRTVEAAVAGGTGRVWVHRGPAWNTGLTSTQPRRAGTQEAEIDTLSLDAILTPEEHSSLQLLKIDVEGTEESVIAGMERLLREGPRDLEILIEVSPCLWADRRKDMRDVLAAFLESGFHPYRLDNDYRAWRYLWPDDVRRPRRIRGRLEEQLQWPGHVDLLFSRRDQEEL